jgi:uncharacterized protein YlzI (FlbEa/FlbD family)
MNKFIKITQKTGKEVLINAANIVFIEKLSEETTITVSYGKNSIQFVTKTPFESIEKQIFNDKI